MADWVLVCESRDDGVPTTLGDDSRLSNVRGGTSMLAPIDKARDARGRAAAGWDETIGRFCPTACQSLNGESLSRTLFMLEMLALPVSLRA